MKRILAASLAALIAGTLVGCGSQPASDPSTADQSPAGRNSDVVVENLEGSWLTPTMENNVALIEEDGNIEGFEVVLGGSGSEACAPVIDRAAVEDTILTITLVAPKPDQVCTADLRPYNFRLTFPEADKVDQVLIDFNTDYDHQETFYRKDFVAPTG